MSKRASNKAYAPVQFPIEQDPDARVVSCGGVDLTNLTLVRPIPERDLNSRIKVLRGNSIETFLQAQETMQEKFEHNRNGAAKFVRAMTKYYAEYFGPQFNRRLHAANFRVWIEPYKELIYRHYYYGGHSAEYNELFVRSFWRNKDMVLQCVKDGIENIIPAVTYFGEDPAALKKRLGKSKWKKLSSNSLHRNKSLFLALQTMHHGDTSDSDPDAMGSRYDEDILLDKIFNLTAVLLGNIGRRINHFEAMNYNDCDIGWDVQNVDAIVRVAKSCPASNPKAFREFRYLLRDTFNAASILNEEINYNWSAQRIKREHDRMVPEAVRLQAIKDDIDADKVFCWLKNRPTQHSDGKFTATLLNTKRMLHSESTEMDNCISTYANAVAKKQSVVFSVKGKNLRGTLEFKPNTVDGWYALESYRWGTIDDSEFNSFSKDLLKNFENYFPAPSVEQHQAGKGET